MTSPADRQQAALDRVSRMIADLDDHSEHLIVVVNSFVFSETSPVTVLSNLAKTMISLSVALDDNGLKLRCAKALRDVASAFEENIASGKVLN